MNDQYKKSGPSFSQRRRRYSNSSDDSLPNRYNDRAPPRETIMPGNQYSGRSPPRYQSYSFASDRPGERRRRESRSPYARSPTRDRPREIDGKYDRPDNRDRIPRLIDSGSYPYEHSDRESATKSSTPRSAQPGSSSRRNSIARSPLHDQHAASKKGLGHNRPGRSSVETSSEFALMPTEEKFNYEEAVKDFGLLLIKLVDGGADLCALKLQKTAAAKDFEKKDLHYKKSKDHYAKFPEMEDSQRRSRDRAEETLTSMSDKFNTKDEELKGLAIQCATQFIPSIIHAGGSNASASRELVHELEKKCDRLQRELEGHKRYAEAEKKARVELEKKHDTQAAQLSNLTENLDSFKLLKRDVKTLKDELSAVTKVTSGLPKDVKQTFDYLSSRVDKFNNLSLNITKSKEDHAKLNKAFVESFKTIEGYSKKFTECETKVSALDAAINGMTTSSSASTSQVDSNRKRSLLLRLETLEGKINEFPDLDERVTSTSMFENINKEIQDIHAKIQSANAKETKTHDGELSQRVDETKVFLPRLGAVESVLQAISQGQTSLQKKVLFLGNEQSKLSNIGQLLTDLQNDVSLSKGIDIKSKLTSIENRLELLEEQPRINGDSSTQVFKTAPGVPPAASVDIITLKDELKQIVEETQAASDAIMADMVDSLNKAVNTVGKRLSDFEAEMEPIKKLPTTIETVQRSINKTDASLKGLQATIELKVVGECVNWTLDAIRSQPHLLPLESMEARVFQSVDGQLNVKMNNYATSALEINRVMNGQITSVEQRVEASEFNIGNLDKRMNNINSKDLATFMVDQLDSIYPYLRNYLEKMAKVDRAMNLIDNMSTAIDDLKSRSNAVDVSVIDAFKLKLEELGDRITKVQSAADTASGDVINIRTAQHQFQKDIATELAISQMDVDDMKKSLTDLKNTSQHPAHTTPLVSIASMKAPSSNRGSAVSPARSMSNGRSHPATGAMPTSQRANQRSASIQSDTSTSKKRKANGSVSSSSTPKASTAFDRSRKRHKDKHSDADDSDPDFDITQPEITYSDDDD